ncbi:MAG: biopolymer transporter ExbD [Verrucomicrobia bacterium]|nr:biopolymer transporter ExbD [Verrucomicrobiota bacterium]NBU08851.1 biopolymer transporter ExbD [Pseudomonadota bacterium]NDA66436.1 biopolymer transporter ExbD [Verrucomicrobiota bacterium]NDE98047.1 biopolymer transporter ExbD [Verrucomicrobiota bacterium]
MAMDVQDDSDEPIAAINFIPMIDISLVLLIIFMVATTFVSVTGIDLKLPKASTAKNAESKSVTVQLNMQKDVFLNGEKTTWDNLKAGITAKLVGTKDRAVVINIDRGVEYGSAVKLMDIVNQCDAAIVLATEVDK